jgi:hypothetical protein
MIVYSKKLYLKTRDSRLRAQKKYYYKKRKKILAKKATPEKQAEAHNYYEANKEEFHDANTRRRKRIKDAVENQEYIPPKEMMPYIREIKRSQEGYISNIDVEYIRASCAALGIYFFDEVRHPKVVMDEKERKKRRKETQKRYYNKNSKKLIQKSKEYQEDNQEKTKLYNHEYWEEHKDEITDKRIDKKYELNGLKEFMDRT